MPRDLPLSNGSLLVAFDQYYHIRDLYWPHVGQQNHAMGHAFRTGVWADGRFCWLDDPLWGRSLDYEPETLVSKVSMIHPDLQVELRISDMVDFHQDLFIRRIEVTNLSESDREIRLFFHHDFHINGNEVGDTAYYEPDRRAVLHYKDTNWFILNGAVVLEAGQPGPGWEPTRDTYPGLVVGVHQWACGLKEVQNLQGTWRDAEDGQLSGSLVAHGSVDSTIGFNLQVPAKQNRKLYCWMAIAPNFEGVITLNRMVRQRGPQSFIDRTAAYWRLWLRTHLPDLTGLPVRVSELYKRSLLTCLTQIDNSGAVIAANDSDISTDIRDTYSYMWPRDGALVANALNKAGYLDLPRLFFQFCAQVLSRQGYLLHKYDPDGALASSWHPWARDGKKDIPIQEDESALVLWALWEHFAHYGDVTFIKPLYRRLICPVADFMVDFREPDSGLPLPSYDLWEERHGILGWTVGAIWGGLHAAANFAEAFDEVERAQCYRQAADELRAGVDTYLWQAPIDRFARMINRSSDDKWEIDTTIDASLAGLWLFGMYPADDPKIVATMQAIRQRLWVNTSVGGLARYEDDHYHQVSRDIENIPGNPWFICTLLLAEWYARTAQNPDDLKKTLELLEWSAEHALPSGILAEQIHPFTHEPISVSPLTWSHVAYVSAVLTYLQNKARIASK